MTQKGTNNSYFGNLKEGILSSIKGLKLSMRHFKNARKKMTSANVMDQGYFSNSEGTVTLQYPNEVIAVPDNGRYRLYNEMDDCIVCDKCAKVCPVDCIDIEPIKSSELIGNASDGSPIRLYAAKFDIDMAKCCFCGLCTTVCPTECLTMTKAYDFSEFDVKDFNYHYANLSPEQAEEKKNNYEQFLAEKEAAKALKTGTQEIENKEIIATKPVFRPTVKKPETTATENSAVEKPIENQAEVIPKPVFRPAVKKPETTETENSAVEKPIENQAEVKPRPVFRPGVKKPETTETENSAVEKPIENQAEVKPRPVFRPGVKKPETTEAENSAVEKPIENQAEVKPRPIFRPVVKKPETTEAENRTIEKPIENQAEVKPRPVFRPAVKKPKDE